MNIGLSADRAVKVACREQQVGAEKMQSLTAESETALIIAWSLAAQNLEVQAWLCQDMWYKSPRGLLPYLNCFCAALCLKVTLQRELQDRCITLALLQCN